MVDLKAVETEALDLEHEIEADIAEVHISGWLGVAMLVAANLVGVFLHV